MCWNTAGRVDEGLTITTQYKQMCQHRYKQKAGGYQQISETVSKEG